MNPTDKEIAIHIKTSVWEDAIAFVKANGWIVVDEYDNYDKGIDYDRIVVEKNGEQIVFAWDNWFEGEILATADQLKSFEEHTGINFTRGESNGSLRFDLNI